MNKFLTLVCVGLLTLGVVACDDTTETTTIDRTVENGVAYETTTTRETTVDDNERTIEIETETTADPEGLMNKETVSETYEMESTVTE